MNNSIKLINNDALIEVENLISKGITVNHIITDPPYNISQDNNFNTLEKPRKGLDFGEWDRGKFDLFTWILPYSKLLDKNGSMIIFCSYKYISHIIDVLEGESVGMVVKDILVWQKSNPMPRNINRRYVQDMEFAIWAVKKKAKWVFNKSVEKPYIRSIFNYPLVSGTERTGHPTQKSRKLMEEIIKIHTNENETILDPFMGSGTTAVAAAMLNRAYLGFDKELKYVDLAKRRLQAIQPPLELALD